MNFIKLSNSLIMALSLVCEISCDKSRGTITGNVTFENRPVVTGTVILVDESNQPFAGAIEPNGRYSVKDVPFGRIKVTVSSPNPIRNRESLTAANKLAKEPQDARLVPDGFDPKTWFEIPVKYADHFTSGLTVTINEPNTTFDILLK